MPIPFTTRLTAPSDVLMRELDGEAVLLDLKSETYFGLDDVGTRIWHHVTTAPTIQAAYDALLGEYDVDPERLRHDLESLLDELLAKGLLTRADG